MIELRSVRCHYGAVEALSNINLTVTPSRPLALLGRNGAGKTTTMRLLVGLLEPDSGVVSRPDGCRVGYLPEERGVYPEASVNEHLMLFARLAGLRRPTSEVASWIDRLDLGSVRRVRLRDLSKGNAQKVQLAMTLIGDPDLIVLDEPYSGLDPFNAALFDQVITESAAGRLLVLSGHELGSIESVCADVAFLREGRIVASGPIEQVAAEHGAPLLRLGTQGDDAALHDSLVGAGYRATALTKGVEVTGIGDEASLHRLLGSVRHRFELHQVIWREPTVRELFQTLLGGDNA